MAQFYLNGNLYDTERGTFRTVVFYTTKWGSPATWAENNRYELRMLNLITSTMDIKAAYAQNSYRMNFKDKLNNLTENYYVFSDSFRDVQNLIDLQEQKGYTLNVITRQDQTLIDLVNE